MNIVLQGVPQFHFNLQAGHLALLRKLAEVHYDATCREQADHADHKKGKINGPITIWEHSLQWKEQNPERKDSYPLHNADFRTLDLMMKIMEYTAKFDLTEAEMALLCELRRSFRGAMLMSNRLYYTWSTEYVDDLKPSPAMR